MLDKYKKEAGPAHQKGLEDMSKTMVERATERMQSDIAVLLVTAPGLSKKGDVKEMLDLYNNAFGFDSNTPYFALSWVSRGDYNVLLDDVKARLNGTNGKLSEKDRKNLMGLADITEKLVKEKGQGHYAELSGHYGSLPGG